MTYKVIKLFTDVQDNYKRYQVGDKYPRDGYIPTQERIDELSGYHNRQGLPVIMAEEEKEPIPVRKRKKA